MGSTAETDVPRGIDVHHHFIPECYKEALHSTGGDPSGWKLPAWTSASSKTLMQTHSVRTSILSLTAPGSSILSGAPAAALARAVNDAAAEICRADPTAFAFFAALPPVTPYVAGAIQEAERALDTLGAAGVTLYTRYGPGVRYLGHKDMRPLWEALNARRAVVFVHPTHLADTRLVNAALPQPIIDYPHETTRTAVDMIVGGVMRDFPDVKVILSHAGGSLPYLATRAAHLLADAGLVKMSADEFLRDARRFYFDTALSGNDFTLPTLLDFAAPGHVLFGSDFPYAPTPTINTHTIAGAKVLAERKDQEGTDLAANALKLFPQLAQ